jgi:hypothetical protein
VSYKDISPEQLKTMLASKWDVVGFQPTITPAEVDQASTTDGCFILLKRDSSLAILSQGFDDGEWYMRINFLTGETL